MRAASGHIYTLWQAGGPFIGPEAAPNAYCTVEVGWTLREWTTPIGSYHKVPVRYFTTADHVPGDPAHETIVPNVVSVERDESIDQDAWEATIVITNMKMPVLGDMEALALMFGEPGWFSPSRGETLEAAARWDQVPNEWAEVFTQYALVRTYEGLGGYHADGTQKPLSQALAEGYVERTGTWLVDDATVTVTSQQALLTLKCRNMAALVVDQMLYPPLVPRFDADGCCYDDKTEVLTDAGWKRFADVDISTDRIATRNQKTRALEWQLATHKTVEPFVGELVHFTSRTLDLRVTPNHRMLVCANLGGNKWAGSPLPPPEKWATAAEVADLVARGIGRSVPALSEWDAADVSVVTIDPLPAAKDRRPGRAKAVSMSGDDYAAFMGMYLAEGCVSPQSERGRVLISQETFSRGFEPYRDLLERILGREPNRNGKNFAFRRKALLDHLLPMGHAPQKRIPRLVKEMSRRQLEIFWHYYLLGDGTTDGTRESIYTSSPGMADDLQEVAQKLGFSAAIGVSAPRDRTLRGRAIAADDCLPLYHVRLRTSAYQRLSKAEPSPYAGLVYCLSVPNETLYVRRNNRPAWCGNSVYPLRYQRWAPLEGSGVEEPGIPYGDFVHAGRHIVGIACAKNIQACSPTTEGYWLVGDDGGVFTLGYISFFGSEAGLPLNKPMVAMATTKTGQGYWLVAADGGVFAYGDAVFYGSVPGDGITVTNVVDIERSAGGDGYIILGGDGGIYCYGDAAFHGAGTGTIDVAATGLAVEPGGGYWIATGSGAVYAFGSATYHGGQAGAFFVDVATSAGGDGYYLLRGDGAIYAHGDATYFGSPAADGLTLNDPADALAVHPDGIGYWIVSRDGGVFTYGPGMNFYGSLPGPWPNLGQVDGNLDDFVTLVKDVLLWSGFWLNDGGVEAGVFGNIEMSGTYPLEAIGEELLDGKQPIDAINMIKEALGYDWWVDADGGAHFDSGNLHEPGNFLLAGGHTSTIPEVDERLQLLEYSEGRPIKDLFSELILSSDDPEAGFTDLTVTRYTPATKPALRGLVKPGIVKVDVSLTAAEQQLMAEMIDTQLTIHSRSGSLTMAALPLLNPTDQVRVFERQTGATDIQYVRSVQTSLDRRTGKYTQQLELSWLGGEDSWAVSVPSAVAHASPISGDIAMPMPTMSGSPPASAIATSATFPAVAVVTT